MTVLYCIFGQIIAVLVTCIFFKHLKNLTDPKGFCIHMHMYILSCEFLVFSCSSDRNKASLHSVTAVFYGLFIPENML